MVRTFTASGLPNLTLNLDCDLPISFVEICSPVPGQWNSPDYTHGASAVGVPRGLTN